MKYMDFYNRFVELGRMENFTSPDNLTSGGGLCNSLPEELTSTYIFNYVTPTVEDIQNLTDNKMCFIYWGSDKAEIKSTKNILEFTELRQTLLLLCAAINNEL